MTIYSDITHLPYKLKKNDEEVSIMDTPYRICDVRGVWVSTVANIDIPKGKTEIELKEHLNNIIATLLKYNMNTLIFQVRSINDAMYPSALNPWSRFLTGTEGVDPGFDVFGYVCELAKRRHIKVHAWMNPYRVSLGDLKTLNMTKDEYLNTLAPNNYARLHPEDVLVDGANKLILAPSHDSVVNFVTESIKEVCVNYDVEAVHIDDYFYPYGKIPDEVEMPDYLKTRASENETFANWRRGNVNKMIESVYNMLKKLPRKVEFGISPFGIYRTNKKILPTGWEDGSFNTPGCLQCYEELYSDIYLWMKNKWIDYVVPQIYFPFSRTDVTYHDLVDWWSYICRKTKTKLYIGHGLYQMGSNEYWKNPEEMKNQLLFNNNYPNILGSIFFTYHDLIPSDNEIKNKALEDTKLIWNK